MALSQNSKAEAVDWNDLFTRLRTVATNHGASAANLAKIPTTGVTAGNQTAPADVTKLKQAFTDLVSCCSHISADFAGKITVPAAGTLLQISNYATVVAEVEAVCHNYGQYGAYTDYQYQYGDCWW